MSEETRMIMEQLKQMNETMAEMKADIRELKEDVCDLKEDVCGLKEDVSVLKQDMAELKERVEKLEIGQRELKVLVETDINKKINVVGDGHFFVMKALDELRGFQKEKEQMDLKIIDLQIEVTKIKKHLKIA